MKKVQASMAKKSTLAIDENAGLRAGKFGMGRSRYFLRSKRKPRKPTFCTLWRSFLRYDGKRKHFSKLARRMLRSRLHLGLEMP